MNLGPQDNPFRRDFVGGPWESINDIPEINQRVSDYIFSLLEQIRSDGKSQNLLIFSGAGHGKTHLLSRIRRQLIGHGTFTCFQPHGNPQTFARQALWQIGESLLRPSGIANYSQLDILTARVLSYFYRHQQAPPAVNSVQIIESDPSLSQSDDDEVVALLEALRQRKIDAMSLLYEMGFYWQRQSLPIHEEMLEVLLQRISGSAEYQWQANKWLKGQELPDTVLASIGVSSSLSQQATSALGFLGSFASVHQPLVLAIDQVEVIFSDSQAIPQLIELIVHLRHNAPNYLIILSCLEHVWQNALLQNEKTPQSMHHRFEEHRLYLDTITIEQRQAIIRQRLALISEEHRQALICRDSIQSELLEASNPWWPFSAAQVEELLRLNRPRLFLKRCAQFYAEIIQGSIHAIVPGFASAANSEDLDAILDQEFAAAYSQFSEAEKDSVFLEDNFLQHCHELLVYYQDQAIAVNGHIIIAIENCPLAATQALKLTCHTNAREVIILLVGINSENGRSVAASLNHIARYQKEHPQQRIFVLRDQIAGEIQSTWKRALETSALITANNGKILLVSRDDYLQVRVSWHLTARVGSQEIFCGKQPVTGEALADYLRRRRPLPELPLFLQIFPPANELLEIMQQRHLTRSVHLELQLGKTAAEITAAAAEHPQLRVFPQNSEFIQYQPDQQESPLDSYYY